MLQSDWLILLGVGGFFIVIGVVAIFLGRGEERGYYDSLGNRIDVKEFLEHQPERPEFGALQIGGCLAIVIGLVMLVMGGIFRFWGPAIF